MELTIEEKKNPVWDDLIYSSFKPNHVKTSAVDLNHNSLKEFISYLTKLSNDRVINETQFRDLLMLICSNYIENEVEARISKKFGDQLFKYFL